MEWILNLVLKINWTRMNTDLHGFFDSFLFQFPCLPRHSLLLKATAGGN